MEKLGIKCNLKMDFKNLLNGEIEVYGKRSF
jgi:hypothetical protein